MSTMSKSLDADRLAQLAADPAEHGGRPAEAQGELSGKWEGAEYWMPLAWQLCADECGEDACEELVWEGGPIPEPWGERWLKYEHEAKRLIALVHENASYPSPAQPVQVPEGWRLVPVEPTPEMADAAERLDWADADVRANCINQWSALLAAAPLPPAQPKSPKATACPHRDEPRGCYRVRCQLGRKCVAEAEAQPVGREPMSRTDMARLFRSATGETRMDPSDERFGRAVERAHGITREGA